MSAFKDRKRVIHTATEGSRIAWEPKEYTDTPSGNGKTLTRYKKIFMLSCRQSSIQCQYNCLFNLGAVYVMVGNHHKGLKCLQRCVNMLEMHALEDNRGDLHLNIGLAYEGLQRLDKALPFYRQAVRRFRLGVDPSSMADALVKLAYCWLYLGCGPAGSAARAFSQAARAYQQAGRREEAAIAQREAAKLYLLSEGACERQIIELLEGCLQDCRQGVLDACLRGRLLNDVGLHYCTLRRFSQAGSCFREALADCCKQTSHSALRAVLLQNLGAIMNAQRQFSLSLIYHIQAAELFGGLCQWKGHGESLGNLASAYSQMSLHQAATLCFQEASEAFKKAGDIQGQWFMSEGLAATKLCLQATDTYNQALTLPRGTKEAIVFPDVNSAHCLVNVAGGALEGLRS